MKKILLSTLALMSLQIVTAQTLTEANHSPSAWDGPYSTKQCDSLTITPGVSGVGAVWSYTPVGYSTVNVYTSSHSTNTAFPMAYAVVKSGTVSEAYYSSSPTTLNYYGGTMSLSGQAVTLNYSTPLKAMTYPMTAINTITSSPTGTLSASGGAISGSFTGNAVVKADASGALNLPGRTFNDIIRIVTTQTLNAVTGLGPITVTQKVYDYYSVSASKAPIISINSSTISSTLGGTSAQTFVTVLNGYTSVGVKENTTESIELSVFPNPANSYVSFNTSSIEASKVTVYDVTGRVVATDNFEIGKCKLDVSSLNGGVYIYSVLSKNNQTLKTGKFSVTK